MKIRRTAGGEEGSAARDHPRRGAHRAPFSPFESLSNLHPLTAGAALEYFEALQELFEVVEPPATAPAVPLHLRLRLREEGAPLPTPITASLERPGFPVALGRFLAWLCDRSYDEPGFLGGENPAPPAHPLLEHQRSFDRDHAQGLGLLFEDHAFLVFRGSESRVDWFRNFLVRRNREKDEPAVRVHRGFRRNVDLLWPEVEEWLSGLPPTRGLILGGHSLGGAMAMLAARRLAATGRRVAAVVTFGSPRVGGSGFGASYERLGLAEKTWRVVWGGDLVAKVPPPFGYRHVGELVAIGSARQMETDPVKQPLAGRSNDLWRTMAMLLSGRSPWIYAVLQALPYVLGLAHAGREHMRSLGYSWVHDGMLERQLEAALAALEPELEPELEPGLDGPGREVLVRMHRAYFTGAGVEIPAPTGEGAYGSSLPSRSD